jgi:DNA-binding Lrp family transcriptional regulator
MNVKGYLLIQTQMGKAKSVVDEVRKLPGILSVDVVTGSWDAIAVVSGESIQQIGEMVTSKVRKINGVERTLTSFVI